MGLLFGFDLQAVFDLTEKPVGPIKIDNLGVGKSSRRSSAECVQSASLLQESVPTAVDELERLHHEFDFTNASASEFNVTVQVCSVVVLDPPFDVCDLVQQIGSWAVRINKRLVLPQEFVDQFATAGDAARLN